MPREEYLDSIMSENRIQVPVTKLQGILNGAWLNFNISTTNEFKMQERNIAVIFNQNMRKTTEKRVHSDLLDKQSYMTSKLRINLSHKTERVRRCNGGRCNIVTPWTTEEILNLTKS